MTGEVEGAAVLDDAAAIVAPPQRGLFAGVSRNQISVVAACLLGNMISPTPIIHGPFGTFLIPISHEFGWPRARVSGVLSVLAIMTALAYPIIGRLADRFGPRRLILAGNLAFGCCVVALGFSRPNILLFYGLFA